MLSLLTPFYLVLVIALLAVWLAAYVLGMVRGHPNEDRSRRLARPAKLVMIAAALGLGLLWLSVASGSTAALYANLIFLGLLAGAVGDIFLADMIPVKRPEIGGMIAFGIGHLLYFAAILAAAAALDARTSQVVLSAIAGGALGIGVWAGLVRNPGGSRTLNVGSLVYGILLVGVAAAALALWWGTGTMVSLAVGMVLFAISDMMLAQYLIRQRGFPSIRDVVWIIYSSAQVIIAFSIGAAVLAMG